MAVVGCCGRGCVGGTGPLQEDTVVVVRAAERLGTDRNLNRPMGSQFVLIRTKTPPKPLRTHTLTRALKWGIWVSFERVKTLVGRVWKSLIKAWMKAVRSGLITRALWSWNKMFPNPSQQRNTCFCKTLLRSVLFSRKPALYVTHVFRAQLYAARTYCFSANTRLWCRRSIFLFPNTTKTLNTTAFIGIVAMSLRAFIFLCRSHIAWQRCVHIVLYIYKHASGRV